MKLLSPHSVGLVADTINDVSSTRKVYLLAGGLAALGLALIVITVWFWRNTRHDPELLAPLETMGQRKFRALDGKTQQQMLDQSRPPKATPMRWGVVRGEPEVEDEVDLDSNRKSDPPRYDDLADQADGVSPSSADRVDDDVAPVAPGTSSPVLRVGARDATSPTVLDPAERRIAAAVMPLVIKPIDHDMPPVQPARPVADVAPPPTTISTTPEIAREEEPPEPAARQSIDPLLRMFDRTDG